MDDAEEFPEPDPQTVPDTLEGADLSQIQALLFRGWASNYKWSTFLFVEIPADVEKARNWLAEIRAEIAWGDDTGAKELPTKDGPKPGRLQLALTTRGLRKLGLEHDVIDRFPFELKAGMERRARILGDEIDDANARKNLTTLDDYETGKPIPKDWLDTTRGGINLAMCDAMILLYARTSVDRELIESAQRKRLDGYGGHVVAGEQSSRWMDHEPFGYADGLSQPKIRGSRRADPILASEHNTVNAGEFVLGYRNEYGKVPKSPRFAKSHPKHPELDVGKNGTFLVFRKLEQNVVRFWKTFAALGKLYAGQKIDDEGHTVPTDHAQAAHWLAARAMGRWTNGNSTMSCPFDDGGGKQGRLPDGQINHFTYADDPDGLRCPIGSHVRRANPRDQRGGPISDSWKVVKRHRILRRGRAYGRLYDPDKLLAKILADETASDGEIAAHATLASMVDEGVAPPPPDPEDDTASGLLFVCLQANITHGFEFVQQIWNNNPGFHGVFQEPDVIAGPGGSRYTIPAQPVRMRLEDPFPDAKDKDPLADDKLGMPRLVIPRGGGYFFVPSRATVDLLVDG